MSIRLQILIACFALVTITLSLGAFAYFQERELGSLATDIYDNALVGVSYAQKAQADFLRLSAAGEPASPSQGYSRERLAELLEDLDVARDRAITPEGKALAAGLQRKIAALGKQAAPASALRAQLVRLDGELGGLAAKYNADGFVYRVRTDRVIAKTTLWAEIAASAAVILAFLCAIILEFTIVPPIRRAVAIASAVAAGDLSNKIAVGNGRSETSRLLRALSAMQHSVAESIKRAEALRASEAARIVAEYESSAAQRANRAKSEFLASMSHELRTPLNAILGFSEAIKEQMFGPLPSKYQGYAGDIHTSGQHLLALINDILDLSKLEAGKFELRETSVDVTQVIAECTALMRRQAEQNGLLITTLASDPTPSIQADARLMKQIVLNLLSNAVKFTPSGGVVSVKVFAVCEQVGFAVSDTGIGMSSEEIQLAMTPFGQIDSRIARRQQGTGLGLTITRSLVELHRGTIKVESKTGIGTTVTVIVPVSRSESQAA
jgi:signal transduction histidine kinase